MGSEKKAQMKAQAEKTNNRKLEQKKIVDAKMSVVANKEQLVKEEGALRVRNSPNWEDDSFLKFPCNHLKEADSIVEGGASLMLYKFDKSPASPVAVHAASCAWNRETLTFTQEIRMPTEVISKDNQKFIDTSKMANNADDRWFNIKLDGAAVQKLRLAGETLCFKIMGGPAEETVVLGSEMSKQRPILKLLMKKGVEEEETQGEAKEEAEEKTEKAKA